MPMLNGKNPIIRKSMLDDIIKFLLLMEEGSKKQQPEKISEDYFIDGPTWIKLRTNLITYDYCVAANSEDFQKGLTVGDCLDRMSVFKALG